MNAKHRDIACRINNMLDKEGLEIVVGKNIYGTPYLFLRSKGSASTDDCVGLCPADKTL